MGHIGQSTNELTNEARAEAKFYFGYALQGGRRRSQTPNKIIVSLVNLERETAGGIAANVRTYNGGYTTSAAPLLLSLNTKIPKSYKK